MTIHLTFQDFSKLAASGQIEKDGVTIMFGRPVLAKVEIDANAKTGTVVFHLDETDDRRLAEL
jgi:hypothetical protein